MGTLVQKTAEWLTELSLAGDAGRYLGNEDELLARFRVSRPTLRQAAKMVANDRLIDVRRGSGGGFYASRPDAADSVRTLARYLRIKGASLLDIMAVTGPIGMEGVVLAAECEDPVLRGRLAVFSRCIDANDTPAGMIRAETELARLLAEMSNNPAIELVMAIGYSFGLDEQKVRFYVDPADRTRARNLQHALVDAILAGDADVARLMFGRRLAMMRGWLTDHA